MEENPGLSIPCRSLKWGISQTTLHRILWPELEDMDLDDVYFQQDWATCHTSGEIIGLLREKFPSRVISRNGYYNWPPRSCDLTPLDFFHWGHVKDKVYADAPQSIQKLKEKIRAVIDEIELQMCENVIENFIIWMTLFFIINGKPFAIEWNKNQMGFHKKHAFFL